MTQVEETLKKAFDTLKEKGLFKGYSSYENWCDKKGKSEEPTKI